MQWWRGEGGGRFESRGHRSDLKNAASGWALIAGPRPGVQLASNDRVALRTFAASGRDAIADRPALAASIPPLVDPQEPTGVRGKRAQKGVTVSVGAGGESTAVRDFDPETEPLGAVELDGRPGLEILAVQSDGNGQDRLILLRTRPE